MYLSLFIGTYTKLWPIYYLHGTSNWFHKDPFSDTNIPTTEISVHTSLLSQNGR